ncbi:hypothetical protein [Parapedobacter koreensis]|uniref:Uncharacterized protein n=1 Tax=Parapedobacter koreensis TaxID=332977 RepID=A0A1H7UFQ9_9SPHI|nr:hypothetical protein [Parapedobacter koreensis]SEL95594.1 hypothetical protein SAMN05421740_11534 [Parapedobacter koreensis]
MQTQLTRFPEYHSIQRLLALKLTLHIIRLEKANNALAEKNKAIEGRMQQLEDRKQ